MALSKAQVDRLGERLRREDVSDDDLRLLDAYRGSFAAPYAEVISVLREELGLAPTGRLAKSTKSIIEKLNRESARLSQVQDIAGCRVITAGIREQDSVVATIRQRFGNVGVVDRRARPSNGYRAVHVLVTAGNHRVEIQVRTALQQLWAELSERLSDRYGIAVKYGGGDATTRAMLDETSRSVATVEATERTLDAWLTDRTPPEGAPEPGQSSDREAAALSMARRHNFDMAREELLQAIARFT